MSNKIVAESVSHRQGDSPLLVVLSAPSGAGKTTLCEMLLLDFESMAYAISCTTRPPRGTERDGVEYHFLEEDAFRRRLEAGEFLEHAHVHGHWYGTPRAAVETPLREGRDVLLDIDVQGAAQLRAAVRSGLVSPRVQRGFVDIFIAPPSLDVLELRLRKRSEDDDATIRRRLANARAEMEQSAAFSRVVVNDVLPTAYHEIVSYIRACKAMRVAEEV